MKKLKKFFGVGKNKDSFDWTSLSSREQKKIIKEAVSGSNRLQRDLYRKAELM